MAFTKFCVLAALMCLFQLTAFVSVTNGRDLRVFNRHLNHDTDFNDGSPGNSAGDEGNEGNEGDEGNEGQSGGGSFAPGHSPGDGGDDGEAEGGDDPAPSGGGGGAPGAGAGGDDSGPGEAEGGDDSGPPEADGGDDGPPEADGGDDSGPPEADGGDDSGPPEADGGDGGPAEADGGDDDGDDTPGAAGGTTGGAPAGETPATPGAPAGETPGAPAAGGTGAGAGAAGAGAAAGAAGAGAAAGAAAGGDDDGEDDGEETPGPDAAAPEEETPDEAEAPIADAPTTDDMAPTTDDMAPTTDDVDDMAPTTVDPVVPAAPAGAVPPGMAVTPGDTGAPVPAGTRGFDFGDGAFGAPGAAPAPVCNTLLDAITRESTPLASVLGTLGGIVPPELDTLLNDPEADATILLPPDDDLSSLAGAVTTGQLTAPDVLEILSLHVLPESLTAEELTDLGDGADIETINADGTTLDLMVSAAGVSFSVGNSTASVVETDLDGCAGESVIHKIDGVLSVIDLSNVGNVGPGDRETGTPPGGGVGEDSGAFSAAVFTPIVATVVAVAAMLL